MSGGFENSPSSFSKKYVSIDFFSSECFIKRGGKKSLLGKTESETGGYLVNGKESSSWKKNEELKPVQGLIIKDGDSLITGKNGYIMRISFPSIEGLSEERNISLFPDSEIILRVKTVKRTKDFINPNGSKGITVNESDIIDGFELVKGLFNLSITTSKEISNVININSKYPRISFKPALGKAQRIKSINMTLELTSDGSIVIFNLFGYNVVHEKSGLEAKTFETLAMNLKPKIVIKQSGIYMTDMSKTPDYRVEEINKRIMEIGKLENSILMKKSYSDMISKETLAKNENQRLAQINQELINEGCKNKPDPKIIAFLKSQLSKSSSIAVSNETKELFNKGVEALKPLVSLESALPSYSAINESEKITLKKESKRTAKSYDEMVGESLDENDEIDAKIRKLMLPAGALEMYKRMQAEGKSIPPQIAELISKQRSSRAKFEEGVKKLAGDKGIVEQTASAPVNESITYNKTLFKFIKIEKGPEINMARAPVGKEFLFIYFESTNKSTAQAFFSPDEEFRLICNKELIPLRNYRMETNKDPNKLYSNEQLFFVIPADAKEFVLEIGKKSMAKQNVKLKL
ncbi:MAG: hypothetical protein PHN56_01810 [Candidatus Nanoarchaeia archaeon]|nr:hypothetical protein [Candidatus Nanoarchaeia archaeon]